jgi:hypothetical protein
MIVYRIEGKDGWGAFCRQAELDEWDKDQDDDGIYSDAEWVNNGCTVQDTGHYTEWRFGCESMEQLQEYFGSYFAELLNIGAKIAVYKVHKAHVRFGIKGIEIAFNNDKAERLN